MYLIFKRYLMLEESKHIAFKIKHTNLFKHACASAEAQNASLEIHCSICQTLHPFGTSDRR